MIKKESDFTFERVLVKMRFYANKHVLFSDPDLRFLIENYNKDLQSIPFGSTCDLMSLMTRNTDNKGHEKASS